MAELIIQRKKEFVNGMLSFKLFLDNKKIGSIANGETKKWQIEEGNYILMAKGGWALKSQSVSLNVSEDDVKILQIESFGNGYFKAFLQFKTIK